MTKTTMPMPAAAQVLGPAALNFPENFTMPAVVVARMAVTDYRKWLAKEHPGFDVPPSARNRTVDVPNYGRVEITLEDGVRTPVYDKYNEPTPQFFSWAVYDRNDNKLAQEKWQR